MRERIVFDLKPNQDQFLHTFSDGLRRYVGYKSGDLTSNIELGGDSITSRLQALHDQQAHIKIVIPTYKPDAGILWGLDQLSRQHGPRYEVNIFHNGTERGSQLPIAFVDFASKAGIVLSESDVAHGVNGSKYEGARIALHSDQRADNHDDLVVIMDDDAGPIFPGWLAKADAMFKANPKLTALYSPLLFADSGVDFAAELLYKASAITLQYIQQRMGKSNHTTEGIAIYRANFLRYLLAQTPEYAKLYGQTIRKAALEYGEVFQTFDPRMLCFVDPSRIKRSTGMLKYALLQAMAHSPFQELRGLGGTYYRSMYKPGERA